MTSNMQTNNIEMNCGIKCEMELENELNKCEPCMNCLFCPINPNDDIKNVFTTLVDEGVYSSDIRSIQDAIKKYGYNLDYSYTIWAQSFIQQIMTYNNLTYQDLFIFEIEKAIETGDIKIIKEAINDYNSLIDKSYIEWANSIILQIVEESIADMNL